MSIFYILLFFASCGILFLSGSLILNSLLRVSKFLGWREFVVAFFLVAFANTIPNLFVGISSIIHRIPQLSFGDVVGGDVVDLTLVLALAAFFSKKAIPAESKLVQHTAIFTMVIAILPLILVWDKALTRGDGIILLTAFFFYVLWLFSKKERFTKAYDNIDDGNIPPIKKFQNFFKDLLKMLFGLGALLVAAEGIVRSASHFSVALNLPVSLIGILVVGLGNALPETYFTVISARRGETWAILGDLMGAIIAPATLVLGLVAIFSPMRNIDFSPFAIARLFMVLSSVVFCIFVKTEKRVTKKEGIILIGIYIAFVVSEILYEKSIF